MNTYETGYHRTPEDIITLYRERRRDNTELHRQMQTIQSVYKGEMDIPLPDMDTVEQSYVPNLLQTGVDQMAGRIASVTPEIIFPTANTRRSERLAETRRRVVGGWWATDRLPNKLKHRARNLIAYSTAPATVLYDPRTQRPTWVNRDPMSTYPSPDVIPGVVTPGDIIFAYTRSLGWCITNGYPHAATICGPSATKDTLLTLIEYHDHEQNTLIAYAETGITGGAPWDYREGSHLILEQTPNPIGCVPATIPRRIALEDSGQFDGMVGMYYMQAKLMALEVIAVERGIFPDTYLEGRSGEVPRVISGPHDGRTGEITVISGGQIRTENPQPGYLTNGTIDRLERSQRITAGVPAEFGGESPTNVRTGRRGDSVLSATIDFPVAEAQEMLALALHDENLVAMKLSKHYDGLTPRTIHLGVGNNARTTTYIAAKVFADDIEHSVNYPISGADLNSMMIGLGQRVGLGTMSKETAAELDPYIADAELEHDRITAEGLEQSLMASLQQQASQGQIPPLVLSKIMNLVKTDRLELPEAVEAATKWYAKMQAQEQAEGENPPGTEADIAAADAAMTGLTGQPSPIPGPTTGQGDLATLLSTLRKPAMTIQPNRGVPTGAM